MTASPGEPQLPKRRSAQRADDLPEYQKPPVVEVVLSLQFSELRSYRVVHAGLLWDRFRKKGFRNFSEHPPLPQRFETFGPQEASHSMFSIATTDSAPVPRIWFIKQGGNELVQVQSDRLVHNWRKAGDNATYPRYEKIKDAFFSELEELQDFFNKEDVGQIDPNQCEVTYVNLISFEGDVWTQPEAALRVLASISPQSEDGSARLPRTEAAHYSARFILTNDHEEPIGRLHISAQPATLEEGKRALRLELTARGAPLTPDLDGAASFFDLGRDAIVRGFTAITTDKMHREWRRTR